MCTIPKELFLNLRDRQNQKSWDFPKEYSMHRLEDWRVNTLTSLMELMPDYTGQCFISLLDTFGNSIKHIGYSDIAFLLYCVILTAFLFTRLQQMIIKDYRDRICLFMRYKKHSTLLFSGVLYHSFSIMNTVGLTNPFAEFTFMMLKLHIYFLLSIYII